MAIQQGYLYNDGLPLDANGNSIIYPAMSAYDCYVETLEQLCARVHRDIGYLPNWLRTLSDKSEYLQVEAEVQVPQAGSSEREWPYTGRVLYIEGNEEDRRK